MNILGIETSCDETSAAIVEKTDQGVIVLSTTVSSSRQLQAKWGGVFPDFAAREQIKAIIPVIQESLDQAHSAKENIDAIAVTVGPGLIGSLLVGVETAKTLAYVFNKPIIPVNHLLGHIYASWIINNPTNQQLTIRQLADNLQPEFPALCLIVSGGHTLLALMHGHGKFTKIGETRDDAAGEAFDKIARLLGLPYPGGPAIQKVAEGGNPKAFTFPRPMIDSKNFDFSFSGLKTAVYREVKTLDNQRPIANDQELIADLAASVQESIVDVLVDKTIKAAKQYNIKSILIGGGVAANNRLKQKFQISIRQLADKFQIFIPLPFLCTDNGAVIAATACYNYYPIRWSKISADPSLPFPEI